MENIIEDYTEQQQNQINLAKKSNNYDYMLKLSNTIPYNKMRTIRLFLEKSDITNKTKDYVIELINNNPDLINILEKTNAEGINQANEEAYIYCMEQNYYTDKIYEYEHNGNYLKQKIIFDKAGIDIKEFKTKDCTLLTCLYDLNETGFDIKKLKDLDDTKLKATIRYINYNFTFYDEMLDEAMTPKRFPLLKFCDVNKLPIKNLEYFKDNEIEWILDNISDDNIEKLLIDLIKNPIKDGQLRKHIIANRCFHLGIDENFLKEYELNEEDGKAKEKIFMLAETRKFTTSDLQKVIDDYDFYKDKIVKITDIANKCEKDEISYLLNKFSREQYDFIYNKLAYDYIDIIPFVKPEMTKEHFVTIEEIIKAGNEKYLFKIDNYEKLEPKDLEIFVYLESVNIKYDKNNINDYYNKYIEAINKDFETLARIYNNSLAKISIDPFEHDIINYILEYNKTNKPILIKDYLTGYSLTDIKKMFPLDKENNKER